MKVSVFGLGYVGCVTAACLAESGHQVCGVDISLDKVAAINDGRSPIVESRVDEMIRTARERGRLRATGDAGDAIATTDVTLVCVGTPTYRTGGSDLTALAAATEQIGTALRAKEAHHCIAFRSTVLPGTVRTALIPGLEGASGRRAHRDFDVCMHPEFLREGSAVTDFYRPPFIVIGEHSRRGGDHVARLYEGIPASVERTTYEAAELLKYACNAFHALKVTFANEIGTLGKVLGIDSHRVMQLFAMDTKLNISAAYLKPGFAFGGSCLPKDLRALLHAARQQDLILPLLSSILDSNRLHLERIIERILSTREKRIGVLGLSFKPGTDDLRESPAVTLIETLVGKGCQVKVYDPDVQLARIVGANKRFIDREIPHISALMCTDLEEVLNESDVIVIGKPIADLGEAFAVPRGRKVVLDLVRVPLNHSAQDGYEGICW
jgi:GDP-mannose 6-dehydrogenase